MFDFETTGFRLVDIARTNSGSVGTVFPARSLKQQSTGSGAGSELATLDHPKTSLRPFPDAVQPSLNPPWVLLAYWWKPGGCRGSYRLDVQFCEGYLTNNMRKPRFVCPPITTTNYSLHAKGKLLQYVTGH